MPLHNLVEPYGAVTATQCWLVAAPCVLLGAGLAGICQMCCVLELCKETARCE